MNGENVRVHALAPILAVDVDGTLADYYGHFRWFGELYSQRSLPDPNNKYLWENTEQFSEVLGLPLDEYRTMKLAYRQGGMKRSLPVLDDQVSDNLQALRGLGIQVWIATTRPWQRLDNIDPDTNFWLDRNVGRTDGLIYGEDKYDQLIEIAEARGQRILGVVDDLGENVERAAQLGLNVALRVGPQNTMWRFNHPNFRYRVFNSWGIYNYAIDWLNGKDPTS